MTDRIAFLLLCALVFTIPWEKSVMVPGVGTLTKGLGGLTLAAGAAAAAMRGRIRGPNVVLVLAAAFVCWSGLTWLWSLDAAATLGRLFTYVQLVVFAWLVWDLCRTRGRQAALLGMYVGGACVASAATFARFAAQQQTYYRRFAAPGFDPNDLAITLALSIPMALYLARRSRGLAVWLWSGAAALACSAILLTASRTGMIAAFAGFGFAVLAWRGSSWAFRAASVLALAVLPAGMFWLAPKPSRERLSTTTTEIARGTLHKRTEIWETGLKALKQRPLTGVGAGAYPDAVRPWLGVPPVPGHEYVAHSSFLSVLVETGIAGAVLYAALVLAVLAFVWAMTGVERSLWAVSLGVWAIGAAMLTWEHRKPGWLLLALVATEWARAFQSAERKSVPE